jgi:hypothetical protein
LFFLSAFHQRFIRGKFFLIHQQENGMWRVPLADYLSQTRIRLLDAIVASSLIGILGFKGVETSLAETTDLESSEVVVRRLWLTEELADWLDWTHLKTVVRVQYERLNKLTGEVTVEDRYYITSMAALRLKPAVWLELIRRRWAVENDNHRTWDTVFQEDKRPWLQAPHGMLVMMLLRRLAYHMLSFLRSLTLRAEHSRAQPWSDLVRTILISLVSATLEVVVAMRRRVVLAGCSRRGCHPETSPRRYCRITPSSGSREPNYASPRPTAQRSNCTRRQLRF